MAQTQKLSDPAAQARSELEQVQAAAAEAARIGGETGEEDLDPAERAVREAGGGEAEGFEQAEQSLIEHASHGDQQSAHAILHDAGQTAEEIDSSEADTGKGDHERSSEHDAAEPEADW